MMTIDETIKALRCCTSTTNHGDCLGCPLNDDRIPCGQVLLKSSLEVIEKLLEEKEK